MDHMLYVAMTGARQTLQAQTINTHNLANASTTGFCQDLAAFRSMPVVGEGLPTRVYALTERAGVDVTPGPLFTTGRELDVAVEGEGWIAVQAADGSEAYTRAGNLHLSAGGILSTGAGHPVLGNAGPIAIPPAEKVEVGADGTLSIRPLGEPASTLVELDRIRLVKLNAAALEKGLTGLIRLKNNSPPPPPDASVRLSAGTLEGSNVNTAQALVNMITLARQFEMQIKLMGTAEKNANATDQLLNLE
jgi:flagellar basal-body rod protein FlgF